ncbi:PREDICTED: mucin-17 [Cercocebus atys]|uniref:mucin-17 n=1 Tax=Cercocebus atys TaxID=9531 RepID=UPI0005F3D919|nr:PREDICTED: mucin-17 [Cercocebus atys]
MSDFSFFTFSGSLFVSVSCLNGGTWKENFCDCSTGVGDQCSRCKNGGTWDGEKCLCLTPYGGESCEEVVNNIDIATPETVSAQMELTVTVTSVKFTDELKNHSSQEFREFNKTFTEQMNIVYSGIPEYVGVNITNLRLGSVVVEHDVLLRTKYTPEYKTALDNATEVVKQKITKVTTEQIMTNDNCSALMCFNTTGTQVQNITVTQYDPVEECRQKAKEYGDYFLVEYRDQKPYCISPCESGFKASKNCNHGKCQMSENGARCLCLTTETHWYSGEDCNQGTQKSLVYGLVGAGVVLVLIILVALLMLVFHSKREVKRQKYRLSQWYKWQEENGGPTPGTFQNIGFDICQEDDDSIHLESIYSNFQPSLRHIDPETKVRRAWMGCWPPPTLRLSSPFLHGRTYRKAKPCLQFIGPGDSPRSILPGNKPNSGEE